MKKIFLVLGCLLFAAALSAADLLSGIRPDQLKATAGKMEVIRKDGKPALRITGTIPMRPAGKNGYVIGSITFAAPFSLEGKSLVIELDAPDNPMGFYVRAYNAGAKKASWSFQAWQNPLKNVKKLTLSAKRNGKLNWEKGEISGAKADKIQKIEFFIGSNLHQSKQTITITALEIIPEIPLDKDPDYRKPVPPARLNAVVDLPKASKLVENGKGNFIILHPDTAEGAIAANKVAAAVKEATGVTIPCRPGTKVHRIPQTSAVMLGNLFNNPALQVLYARYQTAVDEAWPGKDGYTVESIPEPFRRGADVIVLGASDNTGLAAAADAFIALVAKHGTKGDLTIPHTFAYRYASSIKADDTKPDHMEKGIATAHQRLKAGTHTSLGGHLAAIAGRYLQYRNPADAKLYVTVARIYAENAKADARKFGGAWGFDSDFPSGQAISGWDLIEHDPALTAADRLDVSNMILRWMEEAIYAEAKGGLKQTSPCSNHLTFCSMGSMSAGFYFDKYYADQLPQAKEWLKTICHNFKRAWAYGKALDDCDGYQWLTWRHVLVYAMSYPDDTPLQTTVPTAIRIAGITMDNLGYQAPYGDTSGWTSSGSIMPVLRMYYAATRDPLAAYLLSRKAPERVIAGNYNALPGKVEEPKTLNGVVLHPLDQGYYRFVPAEGKNPPLSRCFDKMTFRENMDPASLYVLVDGINNGGHRHADANSVLRFTQFGREWLAENNYFKPQQKYHNTLLLLCNGESFALPDYMEVRGNRENDETAAISIRAMEYGPAEWVRHYVWLKKDQAWMLIDEVTASKEGNFRLTQRWNGIGDAVKRPDGVELQQTNAAMRLQTPGTHAVTVTDDPELGESWAGYPFATTPVIRVIDQQFEGKLQKGETVRMASLWHGIAGKDNAPEWSIDSNGGEYRINTGKNTYTVTFDAGKLPIVRSAASTETVVPRKAAADVAAGSKVPAPEILYQNLYSAKSLLRLTAPENRKILNIQVTAPEPGENNVLVPSAVNAARAVSDGGWYDAGDCVMYKPDVPVTVDFTLETPRAFTEAELRLWWGSTSTKGTAYQLKSVEVLAGNDLNSLKRLALLDTSKDQHPDFGKTVVYRIPVKTEPVKYVRFHLVPRAGTALYIGEITLLGNPVPGDKISGERSNLSRIIAAKKGNEKCYVISSAEGIVRLLTTDGKPAGEFRIAGGVDDMATYDLDNDGTDELLLGCQDGYLRAVGLDGAEKWKVKFEFYRTFPKVTVVRVADLDNDGEKEILAGVENWRTYAFDRTGKEIWRFEVIHPTRSVQPIDLDGDGKLEVICGTRYMWARVLSPDGLHRWGGRFGTGCRATAAPKTGKDGVRNVVLGLNTGLVTFHQQKSGKEIARFLTGDEIFMMTEVPAANGAEDVLVASYNGYVYRFSATGKQIWNCALPAGVVVLRTMPYGKIVAGTVAGDLCIISPDGKLLKSLKCNGKIRDILADGTNVGAVTDRGEVVFCRI